MRLRNSRRLLLDTNAFIYFLNDLQPYSNVLGPLFEKVQAGRATIVASVITEAELLVRPIRERNARAIERVADLLSERGIEVVDVDRAIARRAAQLRAGHKPLRLPDAMIIATALDAHCDLIVGNDAEWSKLEGIPYVRLDDIIDA